MQIVFVDDGSTDGSSGLIDEFAERRGDCVVIHQENSGNLAARAVGFDAAEGEYVGWTDNDDYIEPNMFERLYSVASSNNSDCVICDYDFFPEGVPSKAKWFKEWKGVVDWRFLERNTQMWNKLVRRSLLESIRFGERIFPEGEGVYLRVLINAKNIVTINEPLYHYRVGHNSTSGGFADKVGYHKTLVEMGANQRNAILGTPYEESLAEYFDYRYAYAILRLMTVSAYNRDRRSYGEGLGEFRSVGGFENPYMKLVLDDNYGALRSLVLRRAIPSGYTLASLIARAGLK